MTSMCHPCPTATAGAGHTDRDGSGLSLTPGTTHEQNHMKIRAWFLNFILKLDTWSEINKYIQVVKNDVPTPTNATSGFIHGQVTKIGR